MLTLRPGARHSTPFSCAHWLVPMRHAADSMRLRKAFPTRWTTSKEQTNGGRKQRSIKRAGELIATAGRNNKGGEAFFHRSRATAPKKGARSGGRRAATSLARLWRDADR